MPGTQPPVNIKLTSKEGLATSSWQNFNYDLYNTLGGQTGKLYFKENYLTTNEFSGDIYIGDGRGDVYINGFKLSDSLTAGDIAYVDTDNNLLFDVANVVFANYEVADVQPTYETAAPSGWVMMTDGTIGSTVSGATARANDDTRDLYIYLYNNYSDTICPVTGGRGSTAETDYAANKPLKLPLMQSRAIACAGTGAGLTAQLPGAVAGAETVSLTGDQNPTHTHYVRAQPRNQEGFFKLYSGASDSSSVANAAFTSQSTGSGNPHANIQPYTTINFMIKL